MSDIASFTPATSGTWLDRVKAAIDRWLLTYAEITIRNGDVSRCEV